MLDQEQLLILNIFKLTDYEIIRPLKYQINDQYFSLGVSYGSKSFILLFAIKNLFPLQLINNIQIGRLNFLLLEQYLLYQDQNDVLILFNFAEFEVQIDNFQSENITERQYNFHVVPIDSKNSPLNLSFTLQYYNNCYKLISKSKHALLNYSKNNTTQIQTSKYFFGPIDQLTIVEKENFRIDGPLILSELTLSDNIPKEFKIKTIEQEKIFTNAPNIKMKLVQFENKSIILINNLDQFKVDYETELLVNMFQINEQSILFLFLSDQQRINGRIYLIDEIKCNLRQDPIFKINISYQTSDPVLQSFRTGNLIVIQTQNELLVYQIVEFSIKKIDLEFQFNNFLKINGYNQLYISQTFKNNMKMLLFQILLFNGFQFEIQGTATLQMTFMFSSLKKQLKLTQLDFLNEFSQYYFLECIIEDETAKLLLLQIINRYIIISEIFITMQNFEISYSPLKFIRNSANFVSLHLEYYYENKLILRSSSDETFFYDLSEQQNLYDYIGKQSESKNQYHKLNTTHFLIYEPRDDKIFIATIGYQVQIDTEYEGNKSFTLEAQNRLSQIKLTVQIQDIDDDQIDDKNSVIIFLLIFFVIFVLYFLIRRMRLKHRQVKNQNFSGLQ
ncbi:unnamed protein product (macronuclear) [Paramecium tetraurelia]|uniref:Transmembrane protein n=1 Tax=Paramecium tetraurelia TaxID=5888 RepID=A0D689_PARTE|nr:uncharacterized protein GSPATT00039288001 [Paramecium tetraurelia]CAK78556.1 unnamed protein product [Paramecium tetraurelia]|eukprot:XP_001445953.1 hypothetical protein (macronuclear) [Paramecium tetraurelia strain d4-2]